jgi:translation initiation factor IF-1
MKYEGQVLEALANGQFMVQLPNQKIFRCYLAGKMRMNHIKILVGDKVTVELPQGSEIGRIVYRNK